MTNAQEPTANQNWLYQIGYRIGYHYIWSLMHIPRVNISLAGRQKAGFALTLDRGESEDNALDVSSQS